MEPPLRIELSKFSHFDVIQLVLPFIPGLVVTVGLMLSTSSLAHRFGAIPLGYKTKLAVAIAITLRNRLSDDYACPSRRNNHQSHH